MTQPAPPAKADETDKPQEKRKPAQQQQPVRYNEAAIAQMMQQIPQQ
jgi:hypothetical protein